MNSSHLRFLFTIRGYLLSGALLIMAGSLFAASGIYTFTLNSIDGQPAPLANYKGKVVLVVNVASQCGYTPQYSAPGHPHGLEDVAGQRRAQVGDVA
ncbi:MAG: hypothetical protein WAU76_13535, partial [Candidatus Sulfotelmatobacter sp.]